MRTAIARRRLLLMACAAAAGGLAGSGAAMAQAAYPNRPLKLIVPFAAGGGPDVLARQLGQKLAEALGPGASVVVENVVGAGGIVAAQNVARLAPDGYNLLLGASSHVVQKAMQPGVLFDPLKDFTPIARTAISPSVLVVAAQSPYRNVAELVEAAKAAPGKLNYGSGGIGSAAHLSAAALVTHAGLDAVHVPYKGSVEIVPSIVAGDTHFAFPIASTAVPQVKAGRVRALAVTSAQRLPGLPDVPTLAEAMKAPELVLDAWFGLWAPAGLPAPLLDTLFRAVERAHADGRLRADAEAAGSLVSLSASPADFARFMEAETRKFNALVKAARLGAGN
jgi:tripartite-type tricarboxylate transporter receptor subunit TctC